MKFTLAAHLEELRRRVIGTIVPFFVLSFVSYPLAPQVLSKVKADLFPNIDLIITGPAEAVMTYLWTSALIAATLTFPLACYHVWAFMAPGLVRDERSLILRIVGPSFALLLLGMSFAYLVLLPIAIKYLIQAARPLAIPLLSMQETYTFVLSTVFACGLMFQIPLISWGLSRLGVVDAKSLAYYRRHVVVLCLLVAAVVTDPSPVTQVLLAAPMMVLYELGIIFAARGGR